MPKGKKLDNSSKIYATKTELQTFKRVVEGILKKITKNMISWEKLADKRSFKVKKAKKTKTKE